MQLARYAPIVSRDQIRVPRLDTYQLNAGLSLENVRGFFREEAFSAGNLIATGLQTLNLDSDINSPTSKSHALHADFGLNGIQAGQSSTFSITLGDFESDSIDD